MHWRKDHFFGLLMALVLTSCMLGEGAEELELEDKFGVITISRIRSSSALLHMDNTGSIKFCIVNSLNDDETRRVRNKLRWAVDSWISLLNEEPPNGSFPPWNRSSINVQFGCSDDSYTIRMSMSSTNVAISTNSIQMNLNHNQISEVVVAHEFAHMMGMADTYWYSDQPESMMNDLVFTEDDWYGIWTLWKFLKTGQVNCGPDYIESPHDTLFDVLCIPRDDGQCMRVHEPCTDNSSCCEGLVCDARRGEKICTQRRENSKTSIRDQDIGGADRDRRR